MTEPKTAIGCLNKAKRLTRKKWHGIRADIEAGKFETAYGCLDAMIEMSTCGFCEIYADLGCFLCPLTRSRCFYHPRWKRFAAYAYEHHDAFPANGRRMAIALCNQVLRFVGEVKLGDEGKDFSGKR